MKLMMITAAVMLSIASCCEHERCVAQIDPACACTKEYDPVCGCDGKTYGNACMANCAQVDIVHSGECQ